MGIIQHTARDRRAIIFGAVQKPLSLYDSFTGITPAFWWSVPLGTLITSGGTLQANSVASDGYNIVANPEFTTDTTSWTPYQSTISRVDSTVDPGVTSGGTDDWCLKITNDIPGRPISDARQSLSVIPGASYAGDVRAYAPMANVGVNAAQFFWGTSTLVTLEDVWQTLTRTYVPASVLVNYYIQRNSANDGDVVYFDACHAYMSSAIGYGDMHTPDVLITGAMISPPAAVTSRALILRYQDPLNYVRLLLIPNLAGTDTILETVTAGARVPVQNADVDWTPGGTDMVRVLVTGNDYMVQHMKSGASTWTTAFTTTTASFNTSTRFGVQLFKTADSAWANLSILPSGIGRVAIPDWMPRTWPGTSSTDFTLIAIPDSQMYAQDYPLIGQCQTDWIVRHASKMATQAVLHEGDSVNDPGDANDWINAKRFIDVLDGAEIPTMIATGNHDYAGANPAGRDLTTFNAIFPSTRYTGVAWFDGALQAAGATENGYALFTWGEEDWVVMWLEYGPRAAIEAWAGGICATYPTRRIIVLTHDYLNVDNTRTVAGTALWTNLVKLYSNMFMVISGHMDAGVDGSGYLESLGDLGNTVYQVQCDYQNHALGGSGYLRVMRFVPSQSKIYVETYSPYLGTWETDAENEFIISY